jgi:predicted MPP superfamily phosphohydrolase
MIWLLPALAAVALVGLAYAWFEAGWLRTRVVEVPVAYLPEALDGVRIAHLSDFHLGAPLSRGVRASYRAAEWVAGRAPELVCVTGDLVSHPRGERGLRELLTLLDRPYVVLGNHYVAVTRDPFSRAAELEDLQEAVLLRDEAAEVELRGVRVQIAGLDPATFRRGTSNPVGLADPDAGLRILLCHFPDVSRGLPEGVYHLVLAGHLHAGQISIPLPGGRLALAHPRAPELTGLHILRGTAMHVSPGTGTSLLPLRFFARPEVTELVLRPGPTIG